MNGNSRLSPYLVSRVKTNRVNPLPHRIHTNDTIYISSWFIWYKKKSFRRKTCHALSQAPFWRVLGLFCWRKAGFPRRTTANYALLLRDVSWVWRYLKTRWFVLSLVSIDISRSCIIHPVPSEFRHGHAQMAGYRGILWILRISSCSCLPMLGSNHTFLVLVGQLLDN